MPQKIWGENTKRVILSDKANFVLFFDVLCRVAVDLSDERDGVLGRKRVGIVIPPQKIKPRMPRGIAALICRVCPEA